MVAGLKKTGDGCMGLLKEEYRKQEKMNGVVYDMLPAPGYQHGIINGNIYTKIKNKLKDTICLVFIENLDFRYQPDINDDYVCPDIMIVCDRKHLKGSFYNGVPKFIVETLSPSTAKRDKTKKDAYEKAGVEEYWIVSPQGTVEIYYLEDGKYILEQSYMLQDDEEEEDYNAEIEIALRGFPHIKMKLEEIFEGLE